MNSERTIRILFGDVLREIVVFRGLENISSLFLVCKSWRDSLDVEDFYETFYRQIYAQKGDFSDLERTKKDWKDLVKTIFEKVELEVEVAQGGVGSGKGGGNPYYTAKLFEVTIPTRKGSTLGEILDILKKQHNLKGVTLSEEGYFYYWRDDDDDLEKNNKQSSEGDGSGSDGKEEMIRKAKLRAAKAKARARMRMKKKKRGMYNGDQAPKKRTKKKLSLDDVVGRREKLIFKSTGVTSTAVIRTFAGVSYPMRDSYFSELAIREVKQDIYHRTGIPTDSIRLIWAGKQLEDHRTLRDYNMERYSSFAVFLNDWKDSSDHPNDSNQSSRKPFSRLSDEKTSIGSFVKSDVSEIDRMQNLLNRLRWTIEARDIFKELIWQVENYETSPNRQTELSIQVMGEFSLPKRTPSEIPYEKRVILNSIEKESEFERNILEKLKVKSLSTNKFSYNNKEELRVTFSIDGLCEVVVFSSNNSYDSEYSKREKGSIMRVSVNFRDPERIYSELGFNPPNEDDRKRGIPLFGWKRCPRQRKKHLRVPGDLKKVISSFKWSDFFGGCNNRGNRKCHFCTEKIHLRVLEEFRKAIGCESLTLKDLGHILIILGSVFLYKMKGGEYYVL